MKQQLERIDTVREPVLGEYYLVPVVDSVLCNSRYRWPVIGPKHEDKAIIGFEPQHYHCDPRFVSPTMWEKLLSYMPKFKQAYAAPTQVYVIHGPLLPFHDPRIFSEPQWRRRRMYRQFPIYPRTAPKWIGVLENAYRHTKLKDGLICPHRGAPLKGVQPDGDGCITCPLHGLRWNATSGELVLSQETQASTFHAF